MKSWKKTYDTMDSGEQKLVHKLLGIATVLTVALLIMGFQHLTNCVFN